MIRFATLQSGRSRAPLRVLAAAMGFALSGAPGFAHAQPSTAQAASKGAIVYPARGQSALQQDRDKYECHDWARGQSGFDPAQPSQSSASGQSQPPPGPTGTMVRGAVGGAAVGELVNHDAGRGAAVGVVSGAVLERARQRQAAQANQQQAAQQQAIRSQQRATYDRAFGACLEARGYVVR